LNKLEAFKKKKKPVKFKLIRITPIGVEIWTTSMYVTIEDYEIVEDVDQGLDVVVKLNMKQYRDFGAKKLKIKKGKAKKKKKRAQIRDTYKKYTIKKGDSIYSIAKKTLGDSKRWKEVYRLNQKTLDKVAKKNGHKSSKEGTTFWIYPGTVIKIPHDDPHLIA
jgi:LysM repeat protein